MAIYGRYIKYGLMLCDDIWSTTLRCERDSTLTLLRPFEPCFYFFTAMACNSKCPPRKSDPAPMNSRAGKSFVVK